jgi:hypothetical protein
VIPTPSCDNLGNFARDTDVTLRSMEHTDTREFPRSIPIREDLNPGDTEWLVKKEKYGWSEGDTVLLNSYTDTAIIISEFFETDRSGEIRIVCGFTTEEFLPFFPASDVIGHRGDEWPENEGPEEEHEKYFHTHSVSYFHPLQCYKRRRDHCTHKGNSEGTWMIGSFCILPVSKNYEKNPPFQYHIFSPYRFCVGTDTPQLCWISRR